MKQITTRETLYANKDTWSDYSIETRELATIKNVLSIISAYCDNAEDTLYLIFEEKELNNPSAEPLYEFTSVDVREEFKNSKKQLGLYTAQKNIKVLDIYERRLATGLKLTIKRVNEETGKEETTQRAEITLQHRIVKMYI